MNLSVSSSTSISKEKSNGLDVPRRRETSIQPRLELLLINVVVLLMLTFDRQLTSVTEVQSKTV